MNPTSGSPLSEPTVQIGGEVFPVKYGILAELKVSESGQDLGTMLRSLQPSNLDPKRLFYIYSLFAACVAHNFVVAKKPVPTVDEWMLRLQAAEPDSEKLSAILSSIGVAVVQAIVIHQQSLKAKPTPAAQVEPATGTAPN